MLSLDPSSSSTARNRHKTFISIAAERQRERKRSGDEAGVSAYFSCVFSDTQIPDSDSSLGVKVLTRHVNVIRVFVFILILTVAFPLLQKRREKNETIVFPTRDDLSGESTVQPVLLKP